MDTVTSSDGTTIAFDRSGEGPPVIVVGGATCDRAMTRPLAEQLAQHFAVINHDRRGGGTAAVSRSLHGPGSSGTTSWQSASTSGCSPATLSCWGGYEASMTRAK